MFTNRKNAGRVAYPGKKTIDALLEPAREFMRANQIPASRIYAGEFGCYRKNAGCEEYLRDLGALFNHEGWHWSFYGYREDEWDGMDYEMGPTRGLSEKYWKEVEAGRYPSRVEFYPAASPLWKALTDALRKP